MEQLEERQSLRWLLDKVEQDDSCLLQVAREDYLLSAVVLELEEKKQFPLVELRHPASGQRTVANVFASRERLNRVIQNSADVQAAAQAYPAPTLLAAGPAQENVLLGDDIDVEALPVYRHFAEDAGRYISSGIVVARDPATGRTNFSFHRMMLRGRDEIALSLHSRGDLYRYFEESEAAGKDLEVAVVIGTHPAYYIAGASKIPPSQDDYSWASAYMGENALMVQAKTVDLPVPAFAEYVLEGRIVANQRVDEGPFGEYTGYSTSRSTRNLLKLTAITHRNGAIYQDLVPGYSWEHLLLSQYTKEIILLHKLQAEFPSVTALSLPKDGCHFHAYLSIKNPQPGEARQAMLLLFGLDAYLKLAVVVNEDVNVYNEEEVLWAMATRMQADEDVFIVPGVRCNRLDPSSDGSVSAKMGIDATIPAHWEGERVRLPDEALKKAKRLLGR